MKFNFSTERELAVVYDDHSLFAISFSSFLQRNGNYKSVRYFTDEYELNRYLVDFRNSPIHLFMDYYLSEGTSLVLISDARNIVKNIKIIVVTGIANPVEAANILYYSPDGFISKSSDFVTISDCIEQILLGRQYICSYIQKLLSEADNTADISFTARELEMLQYFNQGLSIVETADKVHLSKHTVVAHRRNMMSKTGSKSITELLSIVRKLKLIDQ